jgi:ferredoxin-thioredoxin reductase catalytic chain
LFSTDPFFSIVYVEKYMNISKKLEFTKEEGRHLKKELTVYALSTCGFCKAALRFLRKHNLAFRYLYVDHLDEYHKTVLKQELKETYGERPMYPFLVIGEDDYLIGFDEEEWYERIGVGDAKAGTKEGAGVPAAKSPDEARRFAAMVANHQGWRLHRDKEFLENLIEGLQINKERYGYYLCPCRLGDGEKELDKDIICPCEYAKPDIEEYGHCYCSLYQSPEFYFSGEKPKSIPERRPEKRGGDNFVV